MRKYIKFCILCRVISLMLKHKTYIKKREDQQCVILNKYLNYLFGVLSCRFIFHCLLQFDKETISTQLIILIVKRVKT